MRLSPKGKWITGSVALITVALVIFWFTGKSSGPSGEQAATSSSNPDSTAAQPSVGADNTTTAPGTTISMVTPPVAGVAGKLQRRLRQAEQRLSLAVALQLPDLK